MPWFRRVIKHQQHVFVHENLLRHAWRETSIVGRSLAKPSCKAPPIDDFRPALFKQILRCKKGEKAVAAGDEGAVTVEVSALQVGASRPWTYHQDSGSGQEGTLVYPVKATYTVRTHYRAATEVEADWVRILNFYVDSFGEWQIGSEEPVKAATTQRVPKS